PRAPRRWHGHRARVRCGSVSCFHSRRARRRTLDQDESTGADGAYLDSTFKHIAIPTDGSKLADKGVKAGVRLAQSLGARVTGVYVVPPYRPQVYGEAAVYYVPGMTPDDYRKQSLKAAKKALASVEIEAQS